MRDYVKSDYSDRETEMMICMKEQGCSLTLCGKTIFFPVEFIIKMYDILREESKR